MYSPGITHILNIIEYMGNGVQCNPMLSSVLLHCLTRYIHVLNIIEYMGNVVQCNPVLYAVDSTTKQECPGFESWPRIQGILFAEQHR
jgi:hypothetical protein